MFYYNLIMRSPIYYLLRRWRRYKEGRFGRVELEVNDQQLQILQMLARAENISDEECAARVLATAIRKQETNEYYIQRWKLLSLREKQVAALVCYGYTKAMAAQRLHLSVETVRTYSKNVLRKFDVNRTDDLRIVLADLDFSEWVESLEKSG